MTDGSQVSTGAHPAAAPDNRVLSLWRRLSGLPAGPWIFSFLLGRYARYSGTIRASVKELEPGRCVAVMRDRAAVRNHLRSVHATALVTFGELASGLALISALPPGMRGIVTHLEIDYLKKARGTLTARGSAALPEGRESADHVARASILDASGEEVAAMRVHWRVGPEKR